jgi:hypothetical protein
VPGLLTPKLVSLPHRNASMIAAAANETEGVVGEDLRRRGPFINRLTTRIFCVGVIAAIKAYPQFTGGVMAPPTPQELGTVPNA